MRKALWFLLPVALFSMAAAAAACNDDGGGPSLKIAEPLEGATISAGNVTVSVDVSGFDVIDAFGEEPAEGKGHIHYFMDVEPPTAQGEPAVTAATTYHITTMTSHTWNGVEPGEHTISAELVNHDHTPLAEPVVAQVTVTVE